MYVNGVDLFEGLCVDQVSQEVRLVFDVTEFDQRGRPDMQH